MALVLCVILNGLFVNLANVAEMANQMPSDQGGGQNAIVMTADESQDGSSDVEGDGSSSGVDILKLVADYKNTGICKAITKTGGDKLFDFAVSMKTEDGRKLTLSGQINALTGLLDMAKELSSLQNLDMAGGLSGDLATNLTTVFGKLDEINKNLSDESKETINNVIQIVADSMGMEEMGIDIGVIDFKTVDFAKEGQVIAELAGYKDTDVNDITPDTAQQIVNTVMQSDVILPLLSSNEEFTIGLSPEQQTYAEDVINELASKPDADKDKIEMLKTFFGLNDAEPAPEPTPEPAPEQGGEA